MTDAEAMRVSTSKIVWRALQTRRPACKADCDKAVGFAFRLHQEIDARIAESVVV